MSTIQDVHLLVLDTLADWEPGLAIAHINRPALGVKSKYRVRAVGLARDPIRTVGGLHITPDLTLAELEPSSSALLLLPGADIWGDAITDPALEKAKQFVDANVPIAAICGATLGLARAGLLDERRHTSNAPEFLAQSGYRGAAHYVNEPAVEDRGVITASAMASLEFARLVLSRLGVFTEKGLAAWYGLYRTREPACYFAFMQEVGGGGPA